MHSSLRLSKLSRIKASSCSCQVFDQPLKGYQIIIIYHILPETNGWVSMLRVGKEISLVCQSVDRTGSGRGSPSVKFNLVKILTGRSERDVHLRIVYVCKRRVSADGRDRKDMTSKRLLIAESSDGIVLVGACSMRRKLTHMLAVDLVVGCSSLEARVGSMA